MYDVLYWVLSVLCIIYLLYKMAASPKIDLAFSALNGTLFLGRGQNFHTT